MTETTPCGLDLGNRRTKIHLLGKSASVPTIIGLDEPIVYGRKAKSFSLLFNLGGIDRQFWFGRDVLMCEDFRQGTDQIKYNKSFVQQLFQAALYEWSKTHSINLDTLGTLNVVTSMPPGLYNDLSMKSRAKRAYESAFNTGQSHMKIRPKPGEAYQIVTRFGGLQQEAVPFGLSLPRKNKLVMVVDLGGGTTDIAVFNGSPNPLYARTYNNGLISAYDKANRVNPQHVELRIFTTKNYRPKQLIGYYDTILNLLVRYIRELSPRPGEIHIIGGGAALMPKEYRSQFKTLARSVSIKDQYINAIANWKEASKNV
jgi:hypothetical protein